MMRWPHDFTAASQWTTARTPWPRAGCHPSTTASSSFVGYAAPILNQSCSCVPKLRIRIQTSWPTTRLRTAATGRYRCPSCRENCVGTCWRCTTRERANRSRWETSQCPKRVEEPCNWLATHMRRLLSPAKKTKSCAGASQASSAYSTTKVWNRPGDIKYHYLGRNSLSTLM